MEVAKNENNLEHLIFRHEHLLGCLMACVEMSGDLRLTKSQPALKHALRAVRGEVGDFIGEINPEYAEYTYDDGELCHKEE